MQNYSLFTVSCSMFKPWHNRIIMSLQYNRLHRKSNAQEWMGSLRMWVVRCQYNEYDRLLTQLFISGLNNDGMIDEILKEVAISEDTDDATRERVLLWAHKIEVQMAQKSALNDKKRQWFDIINYSSHKKKCAAPRLQKTHTNANSVIWGTHQCSALNMARSVVDVGSKTISSQFAS